MAYLEGKPRTNGWVIRIKELGLDGSYQTRQLNRGKANAILVDIQSRVNRLKRKEVPEADDWTKGQMAEWIRFGKVSSMADTSRIKSLKPAIDRYLKNRTECGRAVKTVDGYRYELATALDYFGDIPIIAIRAARLQEWANELSRQRVKSRIGKRDVLSSQTIQKRLDRLKGVLAELHSFGDLVNDPTPMFSVVSVPVVETKWDILHLEEDWDTLASRRERLKSLGLPGDDPKAWGQVYFSAEETAELLSLMEDKLGHSEKADDRRLFGATVFTAYTAARRSELVRVKRSDLDFEANSVMLRIRKGRRDQSWVPHRVPLHEQLREFLLAYIESLPADRECIFAENDVHLVNGVFDDRNTGTKSNRLGKLMRDALADTDFKMVSGFHIHRHTLSSMLASLHDVRTVMNIIGHKTERISLRYQHADRDEKLRRSATSLDKALPKGGYVTSVRQSESLLEIE